MKLEIENIEIDKKQVLRFLGYVNRKLPLIIERKIDEELEAVQSLLQPTAFIKKIRITEIQGNRIYFGEEDCLESDYLAEELKDASYIYLALYTIGDKIEEKIKTYSSSSEMIRGMILDKIGVVALDYIRGEIKKAISEEVAPRKICTQLFPGTKDFYISNQKTILDAFKDENQMISISKHYQLSPIKTVAVVFGIGEEEDGKSMCDRCDNKCH